MMVSGNYGTHLACLIKALSKTSGDVLELGTGVFSTPYLHYQCLLSKRKLVSYENFKEYYDFFIKYNYENKYHEINFVEKYADAKIDKPWDVVLIDQTPDSSRTEEIRRLKDLARYIVIHDSNPSNDKNTKYSTIYDLFRYRADWNGDNNRTTVLSNLAELDDFWDDKPKFKDVLTYLKQHESFGRFVQEGLEMPIRLDHFARKFALLDMFKALDYRVGVEIGTERGRFASDICVRCPKVKLYAVDPYIPYEEAGEVYSKEMMDDNYNEAKRRLSVLNCEVVRKTSMEAVKDFEDNSLDFVFIDGNHKFEYVLEDIKEWTKKVKPGGVVCGHDYERKHDFGVVNAVNKYVKENRIYPWFVLHVPAHNPPRGRSDFVDCWMFIKPERS